MKPIFKPKSDAIVLDLAKTRESVEPAKIPEDVTAAILATVERSILHRQRKCNGGLCKLFILPESLPSI